jgi:hypothetical protein
VEEAFWTEETIIEADELEEAETGTVADVRGSLRDMSITPAPSVNGSQGSGDDDVGKLVNISDTESADTRKGAGAKVKQKSDNGWDSWTRSRSNGDRYLARFRALAATVRGEADKDEELERS